MNLSVTSFIITNSTVAITVTSIVIAVVAITTTIIVIIVFAIDTTIIKLLTKVFVDFVALTTISTAMKGIFAFVIVIRLVFMFLSRFMA